MIRVYDDAGNMIESPMPRIAPPPFGREIDGDMTVPLSDRASELAGNFSPAITNQAWRRRLFLIAIGGIFFEIA